MCVGAKTTWMKRPKLADPISIIRVMHLPLSVGTTTLDIDLYDIQEPAHTSCVGHLQIDRLRKYTPASAQQTNKIHNIRRILVVKAGELRTLLKTVVRRLMDI